MNVIDTEIPDVKLIEPKVFADDRGFFLESYHRDRFREHGIDCEFVQDNHSRSVKDTLRGLHFQREPGQAKLLRVTSGVVWDVAVDIRPESRTYMQWVAYELSEENKRMLYIPIGFAHGFVVLSDVADVNYKCSWFYVPETEAGLAWDDPDAAVAWPTDHPILSERDLQNPNLREIHPDKFT